MTLSAIQLQCILACHKMGVIQSIKDVSERGGTFKTSVTNYLFDVLSFSNLIQNVLLFLLSQSF